MSNANSFCETQGTAKLQKTQLAHILDIKRFQDTKEYKNGSRLVDQNYLTKTKLYFVVIYQAKEYRNDANRQCQKQCPSDNASVEHIESGEAMLILYRHGDTSMVSYLFISRAHHSMI